MAQLARTVTVNVVGDSTQAQRAIKAVADKSESSASRMGGAFHTALSGIAAAFGPAFAPLQEVTDKLSGLTNAWKEHGKTVGGVMTAAGVSIVGAGAVTQAMASKDEAAHQQLQAAVAATGKSYDDYADQIDKAVKHQTKFGDDSAKTQDALRILTTATNDPAKALQYLSTATDLAAAKHMDLSAAAMKVSQVLGGKGTRTLAEFGVQTNTVRNTAQNLTSAQHAAAQADTAAAAAKQHLADLLERQHAKSKLTLADHQALEQAQAKVAASSDKAKQAHDALAKAEQDSAAGALNGAGNVDALAKKLHGQADAAANTFTGKLKAMRAEVENGVAAFGQKYGPALMGVGAGLGAVGSLMDVFGRSAKTAAAATDMVTTATDGMAAADDAAAVSEGLALGPILLIIAGIALLAAGIYELVTHWSTVWGFIKQIAGDVWHWLEDNVIHPIADAFVQYIVRPAQHMADDFARAWKDVQSAFSAGWNFISGLIHDGINMFHTIVDGIERIGGDIFRVITTPYRLAFNLIGTIWNNTVGKLHFKIPDFIPGIGGKSVSMPLIPEWREFGGPVIAGRPYIVGERRPELFVPNQSGRIEPTVPGGAGGGTHVTVNAQTNADPSQIAAEVLWQLRLAGHAA